MRKLPTAFHYCCTNLYLPRYVQGVPLLHVVYNTCHGSEVRSHCGFDFIVTDDSDTKHLIFLMVIFMTYFEKCLCKPFAQFHWVAFLIMSSLYSIDINSLLDLYYKIKLYEILWKYLFIASFALQKLFIWYPLSIFASASCVLRIL